MPDTPRDPSNANDPDQPRSDPDQTARHRSIDDDAQPSTDAADGRLGGNQPIGNQPTEAFSAVNIGDKPFTPPAEPEQGNLYDDRGGDAPDPATDGEPADDEAKPWHTKSDKPKKKRSLLREMVIIVVAVLALSWVLQTFIGRQYVIPSASMENTLLGCEGEDNTGGACNHSNDRIVIDKMVYNFHDPRAGEVVVFKGPTADWNSSWRSPRSSNTFVRGVQNVLSWFGFQPPNENNLVKRVIATGGQTVQCSQTDGLTVNGKKLDEPYLKEQPDPANPCGAGGVFGPITIDKGKLWMMGDNRNNSADSRAHQQDEYGGQVPIDDVRGKVRFIIYPFSRFGGVSDHNPQK